MSLTDKQQRFVDEYLIDLNGAQAAIRCGYSEAAAKEQASRLLTNANIKEAIQAGIKKRSEKTEINQEFVLEELRDIARKSVEKYTGGDRLKALELLGKHLGMFQDKLQLTALPTEPIQINVVRPNDSSSNTGSA